MPMPILLIALAAVATTGEPPAQVAAAPQPPAYQQTFIAPSGEPFHAPPGAPYPVAAWFAQADADHDGKLTAAEFVVDFMRFFARLDGNHDGQVDSHELEAYESEISAEALSTWEEDRSPGWAGRGANARDKWSSADDDSEESSVGKYRPIGTTDAYVDSTRGTARFDLLGFPRTVGSMDINFNGRITREEASYAADQRFDALDADRRGYLTLEGMPQTYAQEHAGGQSRRRGRHR